MHRTGIAPRNDPGGCRCIAVRHDQESIHIVAVLARHDGTVARVSNDYRWVREACLAAESWYGLTVTAHADRTAARHMTRAEVEKASRAARCRRGTGCAGRSSTPLLGRGSRLVLWTGSGPRAWSCGSGGSRTAGCPAMPSEAGDAAAAAARADRSSGGGEPADGAFLAGPLCGRGCGGSG